MIFEIFDLHFNNHFSKSHEKTNKKNHEKNEEWSALNLASVILFLTIWFLKICIFYLPVENCEKTKVTKKIHLKKDKKIMKK